MSKPPTRQRGNKTAPSDAHGERLVLQRTQLQHHTGPIPHPDILDGYDRVVPGAAERVIRMAEDQSSHRRALEALQLRSDIDHRDDLVKIQGAATRATFRSDLIGQVFGFAIALVCVAAAIYCAVWMKDPISAGLFLGLPVIGIIKAMRGNGSKEKDSK